jgi:4-amino-4-deoxy-L-arabinose transferase-like glycosyltransferase
MVEEVEERASIGSRSRAVLRGPAMPWAERRFGVGLVAVVAVGAAIRLAYVLSDDRPWVGGDGFNYSIESLRLADGLGYTNVNGGQSAHHPPGWTTALGVLAWLGGRGLLAQQLLGVVIGLGVVAIAALVGRRYFNARVGLVAGAIAAVYPGFWVFEAQVLSEPLGLLVMGVFMLAVIELRDHPTLRWSMIVGALCGLLALIRSEQLALLVIVVTPVVVRVPSLTARHRVRLLLVAGAATVVVIAPWTIYNETRFEETVVLSSNGGSTLLAGNCPPSTYDGERLGYFDISCNRRLSRQNSGLDRSELDPISRREALSNMRDNIDSLPLTISARYGRTIAVFRPAQTVALTAGWFGSETWPVWLWVVSFWLLAPLTVVGAIAAWRTRDFLLPLLGPAVITVLLVTVSYGEPRYHTLADLGFVVLAAVAVDRFLRRDRVAAERRSAQQLPAVATRG